MYILYGAPATASQAVHWLLIELGVPFELRMLDFERLEQKAPAYLAINPSGHVPTLVIDGVAYAEVAALLMLLAERYPQRCLAPELDAPERADYLQLMIYFANMLQPAFRAWFYPHEPAGAGQAAAVKAHAQARIEAAFDRLDGRMSDDRAFLLGERLSVADFLGTMLMRWSRNMARPATDWANLRPYIDRMRAMASLREVHAREGVTDWIGD